MTAPVQLVLAVLAVVASARAHLTAVIGHTAVTVPVLLLVAVIVVLALAVLVLWAARLLVRDGLRLRPRAVEL
jgi:hypothetical protein